MPDPTQNETLEDAQHEGRDDYFVDVDRMVNEGLGGGYITTRDNGLIEHSTTDTMDEPDSILGEEDARIADEP